VTAITIALWFKVDRVDISQHFVSKWGTGANDLSYALLLNGNKVRFNTSFNGSVEDNLNSTGSVSSGVWYHIVATFNGSTKKIYINGSEDVSFDITGSLNTTSTADLTIGRVNTTLSSYADGIIDEVSIYDRALSADEVEALSQRRKDSADVGDSPTVGSEETVQ
jgi:hypothetical protein